MAGEKQPLSIKDALQSDRTIVIAANNLSTTLLERAKKGEKPIPPPPDVGVALRAAIGATSDEDFEKRFAARVAGRIRIGHLRKGDVLVVAKEPAPGQGYVLTGPVEISGEMWDKESNFGAGNVQTGPLFEAIAKLAHPMFCARRAEVENDYFELRHA